jgi:dTDP-4-amino-4,6-dideoxygalactose transaminase
MSSLRSHGIEREAFKCESPGPWYYEQRELGFNYRLTDLQAALGLSQLEQLDAFVDRRHILMDRYRAAVGDWPVEFLDEPANCHSAYHLAVLRLNSSSPAQHRNLFKAMRSRRIGVQLHYWPIHLQPYYQHLGFQLGQFPNSKKYAHTCLSLPLFPDLNEAEQDRVLQALDEILKEQGML